MERIKNYGTTLLLCLVLLLQGCLKVDEEMFFFASASAEVSTDGITFSGTIDETIAQSSELGIEYWYEYYYDYYYFYYDHDLYNGGFKDKKELYVSREGNTFTGFLELSSELIYEEEGFAKYFAEKGKLPIENICYRTYWVGDYEKEYGEVKTVPFTYDIEVSENGYEWVDLGLPSGLKWATCNVGADSPEEYGDYFAWGETSPKTTYDWGTYKWATATWYSSWEYWDLETLTKYCTDSYYGTVDYKTVLDPEDDAAAVNMGGSWRMPTIEELQELIDECTWTWTTLNGINGYNVEGPNGIAIFLPAAGSRYSGDLGGAGSAGSNGYCWSSSLSTDYSYDAYYLYFGSDDVGWYHGDRSCGLSVRGVFSR